MSSQIQYRARRPARGSQLTFGASRGRGRSGASIRILIALALAAFALISYFSSREVNPITGETQYIALEPEQEIAMGLQAAPQMIQQHGGEYPDQELQAYVDDIGFRIVRNSDAAKTGWQYDFHLLADPQTINAFALPGGQVFITAALYEKLQTEGQLAGVLGHEIGHVVARHGAQRIAKGQLTEGLIGAVVMGSGSQSTAQVAAMIGELVNMQYGREDELESDDLGVRFMTQAGYDPNAMIGVMQILAESSGGQQQPEFFSTHPNPENRIQKIQESIQKYYPNGLPAGLDE
ncbi:MAG: M48 family metallopeptidase [Caldilineaceae bacterium]